SHAVLATVSGPLIAIGVVEQRREIGIAAYDHVAAAASIAPVRPAHGYEALAPERLASRAARASYRADRHLVYEHRQLSLIRFNSSRAAASASRETMSGNADNVSARSSGVAPQLSAPRRCDLSCGICSEAAHAATMQSSRCTNVIPGRERTFPYPSITIHASSAGCSRATVWRNASYLWPYTARHASSPCRRYTSGSGGVVAASSAGAGSPDTSRHTRAAFSVRGKPANRYDCSKTSSTACAGTTPTASSITRRVNASGAPATAAAMRTSARIESLNSASHSMLGSMMSTIRQA